MRLRISTSIFGLPTVRRRDLLRQYRRKPVRCQRITVSGFTTTSVEDQPAQNRESQTQKVRSRLRTLGRFTDLRRTAICCRSARFSSAKEVRGWNQDFKTEKKNAR